MYLSRVFITGPACRNPYEIHRALWRLFPENEEIARDFLFRVGHADRLHAEILLQSETKPYHPNANARIQACKDYQLILKDGQRLCFLLIANPVKTINDEAGRKTAEGETKKCRVPLIREDDQRLWLERKFKEAATLDSLTINPMPPLRFYKTKEERAGKIQPVSFQGVLNVGNAEEFVTLVKKGIGPAKAFGCGLMLVRRV
ncbi:MAG: type I-E CRISPR-associated protein Cas6/Cse3/CasE [Deltaproteobacteria bacterium]|nr:type I-E CRISPR-associated protein Cas6/Cse3/CasE [Deltaproteobacteria bacterium]